MDENLRREAGDLLAHARRARLGYTSYVTRNVGKLGLNIPQYTALAVLQEKGEMTMRPIAEALGVTMGAGTNVIDKLIHGGFASRERGTGDRRVVTARITDKGRKVLEQVVEWATDYLGFYLARLDPEERKAFIRTYGQMADEMTSVAYGPPASQ